MRAVLLVLIIVVLAVIIAVATGFLNINQIRGARAPEVSATGNGITAQGGQTPAFDVETGSVKIGAEETNVAIPKLEVVPPQGGAQPATNTAQSANTM